jgi:predicted negative regulator of RcsB-dependent stress response
MKRAERHHLKENELAVSLRKAREGAERHRREIVMTTIAILVVVAAAVGYTVWRSRTNGQAQARLAEAMTVMEAPVVPPPPPAPPKTAEATSSTPGPPALPPPPPGSYPSERAKLEMALQKFQAAADAYPGTRAGVAARYHAAGILATLGRPAEAIQRYQDVVSRAGDGIYGQMAKLGLADAQLQSGQLDQAIAGYRDLSTRTDTGLPIDAVLMQLGRAYMAAGKKTEARQTFTRIVDEFPDSQYATDARRELDSLKLQSAA